MAGRGRGRGPPPGLPDLGVTVDRTVLIGLPRRVGRTAAATGRLWAAGFHPELFVALDDDRGGVAGCHRSHTAVWAAALADGVQRLTVFEDDVCLRPNAAAVWADVAGRDWDVLLLGAELLAEPLGRPPLMRPTRWRRTHAYALRRTALTTLTATVTNPAVPVDLAMVAALRATDLRVRAVRPPVAGVIGDGISDTGSGALTGTHYFDDVTRLQPARLQTRRR